MRLYLDVCCLNRPFDDQSQERIRLESEAVLLIFFRMQAGTLAWVTSEVVDHEVGLTPDVTRRSRVAALLLGATERVTLTDDDEKRAEELRALGFHALDALHLACAERAGVDAFLTTDDRLLKVAGRSAAQVRVAVCNPLQWILTEPSP
jgi:predicted nucleic acid-binding protein